MPLAELGLVQMQPMERPMHGGGGGKARDAELGSGGHFGLGTGFGVFDADQEEARGGCGGAGGRTVAGGEEGGNGVWSKAVRASLDEGPDQVADHVVEESGSGNAVDKERVLGMPVGVSDGPNWGWGRFF